MGQHVLSFFGIGILSAVLSVATIMGNALRIDKDPAVDGPRALKAEFFGLWIAFACLAWSFMITEPVRFEWILRGIAACVAIFTFALAAYFAGTPEVRVHLDEDPSGFDNPITALELQESPTTTPLSSSAGPSSAGLRDSTWPDLAVQNTNNGPIPNP
jgi:hypothetical protein